MTDTELRRLKEACVSVRWQAFQSGPEMLERADVLLGVAFRHLERIHSGVLELSPAVQREIEDSIARAREAIGVGGFDA